MKALHFAFKLDALFKANTELFLNTYEVIMN